LTEALKDIPEIKPVVYPAGSNLRMTIIVKTMESMTFNKLVSDIQLRMNQIPSSGVTTRLTGTVVLINQVQEKLLHSQIASFGLAFIVIFVIFVFIFRSLPLVMVGVIVNLFPIAIFLWAMVLFRIPLNVATVMIASIAIGIAVDDTAYFFRQFKAEFARCSCWDASIEQAYLVWGRPMTFTSLVTTLGFTILILASFKPISLFGLLGTVTLTAAWAGDVILSPALLYLMPQSLRKV
jgi:predicted RND superfamily exporter protein